MISFSCPQCGKRHKVDEKLAGKRAKCKCGSAVVIPMAKENASTAVSPPSACSSCGQGVQPGWVACPQCGQRLAAQATPPANTQPPPIANPMPPQPSQPIAPAPASPSITVGNESVVKANIDASVRNTVSEHTEGDRVGGDKVEGMQVKADTVVQNFNESGVKSFVDGIKGMFATPGEAESKAILGDLDQLNDDPQHLSNIFLKHVTGIFKVKMFANANYHVERREVAARAQVCGAAVLRMKMLCGHLPEWSGRVEAFEQQLAEAKKSAKIK